MSDLNIVLIGLAFLVISYLMSKNDFKNWNTLTPLDKFGALRTPLLVFLTIIFIILVKIIWK